MGEGEGGTLHINVGCGKLNWITSSSHQATPHHHSIIAAAGYDLMTGANQTLKHESEGAFLISRGREFQAAAPLWVILPLPILRREGCTYNELLKEVRVL